MNLQLYNEVHLIVQLSGPQPCCFQSLSPFPKCCFWLHRAAVFRNRQNLMLGVHQVEMLPDITMPFSTRDKYLPQVLLLIAHNAKEQNPQHGFPNTELKCRYDPALLGLAFSFCFSQLCSNLSSLGRRNAPSALTCLKVYRIRFPGSGIKTKRLKNEKRHT